MKKELIILILIILPSLACYNGYNVDKDGEIDEMYEEGFKPFEVSFHKKKLELMLSKYDLNNLKKYDYKEQSDLSILLVKLGKFEEALNILKPLAQKHPNEYNIIANLGTTYELLGQVEKALFFIKKGLDINPKSHNGSEWIHVKVLEAKLKLQNNPQWLNTNSIIGKEKLYRPKAPDKYDKEFEKRVKLIQQIDYQLRTRVPFTPKPDLITQKLFMELAELTAKDFSVEYAYRYAVIADYFANGKNTWIKKKLAEYGKLTKKHYKHTPYIKTYFDTIGVVRQNRVNYNLGPYEPEPSESDEENTNKKRSKKMLKQNKQSTFGFTDVAINITLSIILISLVILLFLRIRNNRKV